jgi:hypothetical protein
MCWMSFVFLRTDLILGTYKMSALPYIDSWCGSLGDDYAHDPTKWGNPFFSRRVPPQVDTNSFSSTLFPPLAQLLLMSCAPWHWHKSKPWLQFPFSFNMDFTLQSVGSLNFQYDVMCFLFFLHEKKWVVFWQVAVTQGAFPEIRKQMLADWQKRQQSREVGGIADVVSPRGMFIDILCRLHKRRMNFLLGTS